MKLLTVKLDLREALVDQLGSASIDIPATVDLDDILDFNDIREHEFVIDDLLAENRIVGFLWDTQHVCDQRPDLTTDQAWQVLVQCERDWDRLSDPMLETIRDVATKLYPLQRKARPTKASEVIASYGDGDERGNLVDLLTDAMHWCEGFGEPFDEFCATARVLFNEEAKTYRKGE
jgi:hypothetical protein